MTSEEVKILAEKVKNKAATPEEELTLLKFLNQGIEQTRAFIKDVMEDK